MDIRALSILFQAGPIESADVTDLRVERRLGTYASAEIEVRTTTYVEPDDLLGQPARVAFGRGEADHELNGVVMSVAMVTSPEDDSRAHLCYRIVLTSTLALLEGQFDCRIFQDKDVKEIVSEVLRDLGVSDKNQGWRLAGKYPKREYCVQYNESSLAFVSRLLEEEGIFFFSDKGDAGELIVFEDDSTLGDPVDGDKTLVYRHGGGLDATGDSIGVITQRHRTATGKITFRDYDFKKPDLDLTATAAAATDAELEVYDYPGHYTEPKEGTRLAQVRLESLQAERIELELESGCPRLVPGRWIHLAETPNELDGDYLITGAVHEMSKGAYRVHATVIPRNVKYRTPQRTPAPIIEGPQTAIIVAPPGSPAQEIHTDKHGRCKVQFHWDRYGNIDDTSSCWMRVSQQQTSGSMILPRVGWEVIVEFLEGNPDRPLVTGRVFNGKFMPPYALPEGKSRTALQTTSSPGGKGTNEIRMEDKAGSEEVKIGSQKDTTLATGNNKTTSTAANETKTVKVSSTVTVGADQTVKITNGYMNTVKAAQSASVGGNRTVEINAVYGLTSGGASSTSVSGNQFEMDGDPIKALLALAVKAATDAAKAEAAKAMKQLDAAVASKVNQVMGPIKDVQAKAENIGKAMDAVSKGDLGAAAGAVSAATGMPTPPAVGKAMQAASALGIGGAPAPAAGGAPAPREGGAPAPREGGAPAPAGGGLPSLDHASSQFGLDSLVNGAIQGASNKLGAAMGLGGGGGGGESGANAGGPVGAVGSNAAADSATGPGHAINACAATHDEKIGSLKVTIAAAGIHTTVKGARNHKIGAARVELVGGTRAESCIADKTEKAVGLVVISKGPESETVGAARTTMVGGAILQKIGGSHTITATGKAMFVGAFHQIDASTAIVFKCGSSEVVINGGGIAIKSKLVTITAPNVTLTKAVSEA
jgi:type VI secretion system secreted protein VgrG